MSSAPLCLLNSEIVPLAAARISPLDRGFLFGDAVYEAMKVVSGRILFLDPHLARLARSLATLRIPEPPGVAVALRRLIAAAGLESGSLYVQVSRGAAPTRAHLPPPDLEPTLFALPTPIDFPAEPWTLPGLAAVSRPDDRWRHCDVKTTALAASVLGKLEAAARDAVESLFVGADGAVREGGNTNLFVRDARGWHTHPEGPEILSGVTRAVLLEETRRDRSEGTRRSAPARSRDGGDGPVRIGDEKKLPRVEERAPRLAARAEWREAFLCGTLTGVRALVTLDGHPIGDGRVGHDTQRFALSLSVREQAAAQET